MFKGLSVNLKYQWQGYKYSIKRLCLSWKFYKVPIVILHTFAEGFCLWYFTKNMNSFKKGHYYDGTPEPNLIERCVFKVINKLEFWSRKCY